MDIGRAVVAGFMGTTVMTLVMLFSPVWGMTPLNMGALLGAAAGTTAMMGWVLHFVIGILLAMVYGSVMGGVPGGNLTRGIIFGFFVFVPAQLIAAPLLGLGVFSGGATPLLLASLVAHLVYGGVVGVMYGGPGTHFTAAHGRS